MHSRKLRSSKRDIRIALIGVGNVACVFVQALHAKGLAGVWHQRVAGFKPTDIQIVAAFDVDARKVGKDLSESIFEAPNVSPKFVDVPRTGIVVQPGIVLEDEPNRELPKNSVTTKIFLESLEDSRAELALNLLPSGMGGTAMEYANTCLKAGVSFVNATPTKIAFSKSMTQKFARSHLLLVGDDLMSQVGGTAFHKGILEFMNRRGLKIRKSYQLDVGGGNETLRTIEEKIRKEKRSIKTDSISSEIPYKFQTVAGTTDYVDYLGNNRTSYLWIQANILFDSDVKIDIYLRTNDGANAANILLDVIRSSALCIRNRKLGNAQIISNYGFKSLSKPALLQKAQENFVAEFDAK